MWFLNHNNGICISLILFVLGFSKIFSRSENETVIDLTTDDIKTKCIRIPDLSKRNEQSFNVADNVNINLEIDELQSNSQCSQSEKPLELFTSLNIADQRNSIEKGICYREKFFIGGRGWLVWKVLII